MKWAALALFLLTIPFVATWLKGNPPKAHLVWAMLGFLPFVLDPWNLMVAPYATPIWSGYVKGWEFSLLDSVAIAILLGNKKRWTRPALLLPLAAYIFSAFLAVFQAKFGTLAFSYIFQLLRILIVFLAVARVVENENGERAILTGMIVGLTLQAGYAIWARIGGALQTGGSLAHQNLLGFVSHMAIMPAFAMLLAGRWQMTATIGLMAGAIAVILTASRATIALSAFGLMLTLILCLAIRFSGRKAMIGAVAVVVLAGSFPLASAALQRRFDVQGSNFFTEDLQRQAFERAAAAMLADHPGGVGPNHYVFIAITEGYSERAGVNWSGGNRTAQVHHSYWLVAAETGYLGLITFVVLLASAIGHAIASAVRFRRSRVGPEIEILIGCGCALVVLAVHAFYEFVFVTFTAQYLFAALLGIIAGLRGRLYRASVIGRKSIRLVHPVAPNPITAI